MTPTQRRLDAERLLADPTLRAAQTVLKEKQIAVFMSPNGDDAAVLEARRNVRLLTALEDQLRLFIMDGRLAERKK